MASIGSRLGQSRCPEYDLGQGRSLPARSPWGIVGAPAGKLGFVFQLTLVSASWRAQPSFDERLPAQEIRMHAWKGLKFSIALLLFALSSLLAAAQQYEIQRADYGAGNRRIDVTQRLREVVCSRTRFRIGNSKFSMYSPRVAKYYSR